jgi:lysophospholipase L1-like esterase
MKHSFWTSLAAVALFCSSASGAELALQKGDFVAVVGDSITEQKQYSVFIEDYLLMARPADSLRVAQFGWGGETAHGFAGRIDNDMLRFHPTVVTTCFGMNDGGYLPMTQDKADRYRGKQTEIVRKCKAAGVRAIVVGSPGCVDADKFKNDPAMAVMYNQVLAAERDIAREVAQAEGVLFADVYSAMFDAMIKSKMKYGQAYHVGGGDGVHPEANGQLCMAFAFLKALGCSGDLGRIDVNLADNKIAASDGHKVLSSDPHAVDLESSRYPFCFFGAGDSPNSTRSILPFLPFNAELNRLTLAVTGGKAERYRVTWGTTSREFSSSELANGINLAADFPDNPFSQSFQKVDGEVRKQQNFETPLVKSMLHSMMEFKHYVPEESETLERIATRLMDRDKKLAAESADAVIPVKHTIKIEAL